MMPGLNGRELCRATESDPELSGTRTVLMGATYKWDLRECDEDEYISKPFGMIMPKETICRLLHGAGGHPEIGERIGGSP